MALGWFIRALHGWGSNFMVAIVLIHMVQVFLFGAYKYPRELTWIVGVFLLLMTLGMAFTGQVLRFDQDAYWGLGIGASIASRVPVLGPAVVKLMLGGPIIAGATLSRFFALHVFVIPGLLIGFVGLHLLMVLKLGINEWPMPGRVVRRATYLREYHALTKEDGAPFVPYAVWKDLFFAAAILLAVAALRGLLRSVRADGPAGPDDHPDRAEAGLLLPVAVRAALAASAVARDAGAPHRSGRRDRRLLLLLPFLSGEGEKSWRRRPIAVLTVLLIAVALGTFTRLAEVAPWSPHMNAWSGDPVPERMLKGTTALERQGALVFQVKQCRNCHALGRRRRTARPRPRRRGRAPHAGPAHPPGDPGRRQHAGLRQEPEPGGDDGARRVSRDAASAAAGPGARRLARRRCSTTTERRRVRRSPRDRSCPTRHHPPAIVGWSAHCGRRGRGRVPARLDCAASARRSHRLPAWRAGGFPRSDSPRSGSPWPRRSRRATPAR